MIFFTHSLVRWGAILLLCISWDIANATHGRECEKPESLRFSLIPQGDMQKDLAELQPLFKALQAALGVPVEVYMPPSYGAVVEGLLSGAVHLARLGPATYVAAKKADPHLTAFATYSRKANTFQETGIFYYSVLIVKATSSINALGALKGKTVAMVDPNSTSGFLIPRKTIPALTGSSLESYFGQVVFTGSHRQSVSRVLDGQVDAAFVGSGNLASAVVADLSAQQNIRVLWRSSPIPHDPFVYRGQLCAAVKEKIRAVFLKSNGRNNTALLNNLDAIRFVPISDSDYQIIRQIY